MTYTIKPSQVYTGTEAQRYIKNFLAEGWRIVGFRPVKPGESFIIAPAGSLITTHQLDAGNAHPRFIAEKADADAMFEAVWE